jgi:hypothetical protein
MPGRRTAGSVRKQQSSGSSKLFLIGNVSKPDGDFPGDLCILMRIGNVFRAAAAGFAAVFSGYTS